jgi:predicted transcriptional regulator
MVATGIKGLPKASLKAIGRELERSGLAQRQISELTGLSRDTIRRARQADEQEETDG